MLPSPFPRLFATLPTLSLHQLFGLHAQCFSQLADGPETRRPVTVLELANGVEGYPAPLPERPQAERLLHPKLPKFLSIYVEAHPHSPTIHYLNTNLNSRISMNGSFEPRLGSVIFVDGCTLPG